MDLMISKLKQFGKLLLWGFIIIGFMFVFSTMQGCASYKEQLKREYIRGYTGRYPDEAVDSKKAESTDSLSTASEVSQDTIEVKVQDDRWIIDPLEVDGDIPQGEELNPLPDSIDGDD